MPDRTIANNLDLEFFFRSGRKEVLTPKVGATCAAFFYEFFPKTVNELQRIECKIAKDCLLFLSGSSPFRSNMNPEYNFIQAPSGSAECERPEEMARV